MAISRRVFLASAAAPLVRAQNTLRAGAASAVISPALGTSLAGYMNDRGAAEIHDELRVCCAALESGSQRALLATVDSCMVPRTLLDRARQRIAKENSIDPAAILISSTHTHSAPTAMHLFQSFADEKYTAFLEERLGDAARMAFRRLRPASLASGVGREPTLAFNRRYFMKPGAIPPNPFGAIDQVLMNPPLRSPNIVRPAGPTDPAHPLIAAFGEDLRPIWIYANFSLHYAGYNSGDDVSADYFGAWRRLMEQEAGPGCVALLANGCSGNINAVDVRWAASPARGYGFIEQTAATLAAESRRVLGSLKPVATAKIAASMAELELATRRPTAGELAAAVKLAADPPGNDYRDRAQIYARETYYVAKFAPKVRVPVQTLRLGDACFAAFPGETFVEFGLKVRKSSPFPATFTVGLANDAAGYIPTAEAFELGGYETWRAKSSYLEPAAGDRITASLVEQMGRLG